MKRLIVLISLTILIPCVLTGCIVIPQYRHFEIDSNIVSSIDIYYLGEADDSYSGFYETVEPIYEIPKSEISLFLNELEKIEFKDSIVITIAAVDPSFSYDYWVVRVNYNDGTFEFISCDGYGETFDKSGECISYHHFGCDNDEWHSFVESFLPEAILSNQ